MANLLSVSFSHQFVLATASLPSSESKPCLKSFCCVSAVSYFVFQILFADIQSSTFFRPTKLL